jgi:hypothetical protein
LGKLCCTNKKSSDVLCYGIGFFSSFTLKKIIHIYIYKCISILYFSAVLAKSKPDKSKKATRQMKV